MEKIALAIIVFFMFVTGCTEKATEQSVDLKCVELSELNKHNMKLIPERPDINQEIKLVVFDDCTYNILCGVTKNGKTIEIEKKFNSMMKWLCVSKNDTILIGKLPQGIYTVNYKLTDESTIVANPIALAFSFNLPVLKYNSQIENR
jgi:PBP1b-binding outer membrane lipoprotein LpoB